MNDIISNLLSKQLHLVSDEHADAEIFRVIQTIDDKYLLLNKTKKSVDLTKSLNEMFNTGFDYKYGKMPVGLTFQELLFKAIAFQPSDPFEYIKEKCVVIPKSEEVLDYLDGIKVIYRLSGEKYPELTSNEVRLYEHKFKERSDKRFNSNFNKMFNSNKIIPVNSHNGYDFQNGHVLLEFKATVFGVEEDRKDIYLNGESSSKQLELNELIDNFTETLFGRKFDITILDKATVNKNDLKDFNGNNIFRTSQLIFDKGRYAKTKGKATSESHYYCYLGLFLTYDQYCDVIIKKSLK